MRRFSPSYLEDTRRGLWEERAALSSLDLSNRDRILDVGSGTGELTRVLESESNAKVVSVDADRALLQTTEAPHRVVGDATALPFETGAFDLVVCQALLVNLPDPTAAITEFERVSSDLVAAIEPDNTGVEITSTVSEEEALSKRARKHYINGLETDVGLGSRVETLFRRVGLSEVSMIEHTHDRHVEPPYSPRAVQSAKQKVTGSRLREKRSTMLQSDITPDAFESLLDDWQSMGRTIVRQMGRDEYSRTASVPFYVTVGSTKPVSGG